jgi:hypothetical protein
VIAELYPGLRALGPIKAWARRRSSARSARHCASASPTSPAHSFDRTMPNLCDRWHETPSRRGAVEASDRLANALIDIAALGC